MADGSSLPDAPTIQRRAEEILAGPEYRRGKIGAEWIDFFETVLEQLDRFLGWLARIIRGIFDISPILGYAFLAFLIISLALIVGHMGYSVAKMIQRRRKTTRIPQEVLRASANPEHLEAEAESAVAVGQFIEAIRILFAALLRRLELADKRPWRPGTTNREHLRRFRSTQVYEPMRLMVDTIDRKWFGEEPCMSEDYQTCRNAYASVVEWIGRNAKEPSSSAPASKG